MKLSHRFWLSVLIVILLIGHYSLFEFAGQDDLAELNVFKQVTATISIIVDALFIMWLSQRIPDVANSILEFLEKIIHKFNNWLDEQD